MQGPKCRSTYTYCTHALQGKCKDGSSGGRELFSGDGLPSKPAAGGSKVYAGGARSQQVKVRCLLLNAHTLLGGGW